MKIAFTICSNNYLAQASVLAESFKKFNADFYFAVILVDQYSDKVRYDEIATDEIILVSDLAQYKLTDLFDKYDIIELSTAVKPFVFKYFIDRFPSVELLYYFDPDIKMYSDIEELNEKLSISSVLITPHITSPIPIDGLAPQESLFLNYGIYNLGFIGLNPHHAESMRLLDWWGERTFKIGYSDVKNGLFVDQLWINFVPLFFSDVTILFDKGSNMGPWNLHERKVESVEKDCVILSNGDKLKFYHFSSYDYRNSDVISKYYNRYHFQTESHLEELYREYHRDLLRLCVEQYSLISYVHGKRQIPVQQIQLSWKQKFKNKIKFIIS